MNNTPFKDTKESFLGLMECFANAPEKLDFHPLNYQHLKIAQEKDEQFLKSYKWRTQNMFLRITMGEEKLPLKMSL
jgi:hypothetical protein